MDSEALNLLTRQEWNAAYFLGLERILKGQASGNLADQLAAGVRELHRSGYSFRAVRVQADGSLCAQDGCLVGEHDRASREILHGSFDQIARARESVGWLCEACPGAEKSRWLHGLLGVYDRVHAGAGEAAAAKPAPFHAFAGT
jgi:hypothetical protein